MFPLHTSISTLKHFLKTCHKVCLQRSITLLNLQSSTQNLHVRVIVKLRLLNTYVHNQRQYKSKMTKFDYIIPASGGTNSCVLCKHQKASKLQHTECDMEVHIPQPYTLKICWKLRFSLYCSTVTYELKTTTHLRAKQRGIIGHFPVVLCPYVKTGVQVKPFIWKFLPPTSPFPCKSNSYERFCTKARFETEATR